MRIVSIIQAATLVAVLVVPASGAQAKGRRAFGGVWTAAHAVVPIRTTIPDTGTAAPMPVEVATAIPNSVPALGKAPVPEARPVIREAVAAAPWCAKGRVFGSGAGFCEIN